MEQVVLPDEQQRRLDAGLSQALLNHAGSGQNFLGFISYRRSDGLALARWLRDRISSFQPPVELAATIAARDASVGGKQNRVFFDMSYQKPNVDFWDEHIAASLCRSRTLIVLQTPSVFARLDSGDPNWCEREIDTFLKYYGDPSRILVVMGPGAPVDRFSPALERISARWDWVDLRFFSPSSLARWRLGSQYDPLIAKILAKIYDISDGDLPSLNREFAKGRARVRRALGVAAGAAIVSLSGLTGWALVERDKAAQAEAVAIRERDTAVRQRNAALVSQSHFLAGAADELVKAGMARGALALLREALPDKAAGRDRPLVPDAIQSAYDALYANRDLGQIGLPADARAVAVGQAGTSFVIATPERIFVRNGLTAEGQQEWKHDFGAPVSLDLDKGGGKFLMVAADGAISVHSVAGQKMLMRNPGAGPGTRAMFVKGGTRVLITDSAQTWLTLVDAETGAQLGSRRFDSAKNKAVASLIDSDADALFFIVNARLLRISADTLENSGSQAVDDVAEYAMALSPDRMTLYLAAAEVVLKGAVLELDAGSLALRRSFARLAAGAQRMAISPRGDWLALIVRGGVDFFDIASGEIFSHVTLGITPAGGKFFGGTSDKNFMVYADNGSIRWIFPELGKEVAAYRSLSAGAIRGLEKTADPSSFLAISDQPSVTRWAFDVRSISTEYSLPLLIQGRDMGLRLSTTASAFRADTGELVAAYANDSIHRWNLATGAHVQVKSEPSVRVEVAQVAALDAGVVLAATPAGTIQVFSPAGGLQLRAGEISLAPLSSLDAVGPAQAVAMTKSGEVGLVDASLPEKPFWQPLQEFPSCPRGAVLPGIVLCITGDRRIRMLRVPDRQILLDIPEPEGGLASLAFSQDGLQVALMDNKGWLAVYSGATGDPRQWRITDIQDQKLLNLALQRNLLSEADATKVRSGARQLEVPAGANRIDVSGDKQQIALAMPSGAIKIVDLASGAVRQIRRGGTSYITEMVFSARSAQLATIDLGNYQALSVYDVATGQRLVEIGLSDQINPKLYASNDGRSYITTDARHIFIHPVFELTDELIEYLGSRFPNPLTPAQRRAYFLE